MHFRLAGIGLLAVMVPLLCIGHQQIEATGGGQPKDDGPSVDVFCPIDPTVKLKSGFTAYVTTSEQTLIPDCYAFDANFTYYEGVPSSKATAIASGGYYTTFDFTGLPDSGSAGDTLIGADAVTLDGTLFVSSISMYNITINDAAGDANPCKPPQQIRTKAEQRKKGKVRGTSFSDVSYQFPGKRKLVLTGERWGISPKQPTVGFLIPLKDPTKIQPLQALPPAAVHFKFRGTAGPPNDFGDDFYVVLRAPLATTYSKYFSFK